MIIAKKSLTAEELEALNRIVTAYLEFAEIQALSRRPTCGKETWGEEASRLAA